MLALVAFLLQWRTVLVALVTIPVSLIVAALVLDLLGETFNAISFAGLAAAIALVIDEAVVSAENVARRLRRQHADGGGTSTAAVVLHASHEMRSPLAYATLIALLAIVPIAVMEGRPGAFFEPLALSYASPCLRPCSSRSRSPQRWTDALLDGIGRRPRLTTVCGAGRPPLLARAFQLHPQAAVRRSSLQARRSIVGLAVLPLLGISPIPSFKDRNVLVRLDGEPGTSNPQMTRTATALSRELRALPGVDDVGAHVGRANDGRPGRERQLR